MKFGFLDQEIEETKEPADEEEDFGIKPPPAPSSKKKISFTFNDSKPAAKEPAQKSGFAFDEDEDAPLAPPPPKRGMKMSFESNVIPPPPKSRGKKNLMIFEDAEEDIELIPQPMTERTLEPEELEVADLSKTQNVKKIVKSFSQGRKVPKFIADDLLIDTDKINENYTFGGEKGEIKIIEGDEDPLFKEIRDMAKDCLKYMRGELTINKDFQFYPLPPTFRPQTVRGLKTINLSSAFKKGPEHPIIEEVSLEMSPNESLISPKRNEEDGVYQAVLGIVLKRTIEGADILDDSDHIQSKSGLTLLQEIVSRASLELKHKAMQDLLMLTK